MTIKQDDLSDLLALRDGEPVDTTRAQALHADPDTEASLAELRQIKASLQELPPMKPSPEVDAALAARWQRTERPERRFAAPMAIAAAVVVAVFVGMTFRPGAPSLDAPLETPIAIRDAGDATIAQPPLDSPALSQLVSRSQALEARVAEPTYLSRSESALLRRVADIDSELTLLEARHAQGDLNETENRLRELLWRTRVDVLESLLAVQDAEQSPLQYAVY